MSRRRSNWAGAVLILGSLVAACGGNPYGYAREYVPLSQERPLYEEAAEVSYEEVRRSPEEYSAQLISWFGTVQKIDVKGTQATLALKLRFHRSRHLCRDESASSCRVTVSEREGGPFTTTVSVTSEQLRGPDRIWVGSLVRVYGAPDGSFDDAGGPVVQTKYFRHWPRGAYVTSGHASNMRR